MTSLRVLGKAGLGIINSFHLFENGKLLEAILYVILHHHDFMIMIKSKTIALYLCCYTLNAFYKELTRLSVFGHFQFLCLVL